MFNENRDYDYEYNNPNPDFVHIDNIPTTETKDFLQGIEEALYTTGSVKNLEHCLEELFCLYDMKFENKKSLLSSNSLMTNHMINQMSHIDTFMGREGIYG